MKWGYIASNFRHGCGWKWTIAQNGNIAGPYVQRNRHSQLDLENPQFRSFSWNLTSMTMIYLLQMATIIYHSCLSWTRMLTGVAYGCLMSREMVILNIRHSKFGGDDIHNSWVFLKGTISLPTSTAQRPSWTAVHPVKSTFQQVEPEKSYGY